jgi:hypothetical protein
MSKKIYTIRAQMWLYPGEQGNWHFVTIPKATTQTIRTLHAASARGWGSLPVSATIGKTTWHTSIFPDTKSSTFLLPIKASVRRAEGLETGDTLRLGLTIRA